MGVLNNGHYYLKCLTILLKELLWVVQILLQLLNFYGYLPREQIPFDDFGANFFNVSKLRNAELRSGKLSVIYRIGSAPQFFFFSVNKYSDLGGEVGVSTGIHWDRSKNFQEWRLGFSSPNHLGMMYEVCERLVPVLSRCHAVQTVPDSFFACRQEKLALCEYCFNIARRTYLL